MKKIICIVLMVLLNFNFTKAFAIDSKEPDSVEITLPRMVNGMIQDEKLGITVENEEIVYSNEYVSVSINKPIVRLPNKEIEGIINSKISKKVSEFENYIVDVSKKDNMQYKKDGLEVKQYVVNINNTVNYNKDNILSLTLHFYSYTGGAHGSSVDVSYNFDLNTGNTFFIEDVFTNDVDGLEIVNSAIMKQVNKRRLDPFDSHQLYSSNLIAPFKGINYDQKFFLSPNGINVILDYDNPEFYVGFTNTIVMIPFYSPTDSIGITKRFYDENNSIFIKEPINKRFLRDYLAESTSEGETIDINGAQWYTYISYPKDLPLFNEVLKNIKNNQKEKIDDYIEENPVEHIRQNISSYRVGPYVNVSATYSLIRKDNPEWVEESYVYSKTGELINLKDLFIEGYDYESLIISSIEEHLKNYRSSNVPEPKFFLDGVKFKIEDNNISFVTKPYKWDKDNIHPLHFNINYEEIGYENLKIFD